MGRNMTWVMQKDDNKGLKLATVLQRGALLINLQYEHLRSSTASAVKAII